MPQAASSLESLAIEKETGYLGIRGLLIDITKYGIIFAITCWFLYTGIGGLPIATIIGQPPSPWAGSSNIQGFYISGNIVLLPTVTILFLFVPQLMDGGRDARFRLGLFFELLKATSTGADVNTIYEAQLKLLQSNFLFFLDRDNTWKQKLKQRGVIFFESAIWWAATIAVATGITNFLIVSQTTFSTIGTDAKYVNASDVLTRANAITSNQSTCFKGNWAQQAVTIGRDGYVFGDSSSYKLPMIYALGESNSSELPITLIGFGDGLPLWYVSSNEEWTKIDPILRVGCNITTCYVYSSKNPSAKSYVSMVDVMVNFNQMTSLDPKLVMLGAQATPALDQWLDRSKMRISVPYFTLVGYDNSIRSNVERAAYLVSIACAIDQTGVSFQLSGGISGILSWYKWEERPISILSPNTTIWYSKAGYQVVLAFAIVGFALTMTPILIQLYCWYHSPAALWWPALISFSSWGPYRLFKEYNHPAKIEEGSFVAAADKKLFLYFNKKMFLFRLDQEGFETTHPGYERITREYRDVDMNRGIALPLPSKNKLSVPKIVVETVDM